jgi:hypothetical protein
MTVPTATALVVGLVLGANAAVYALAIIVFRGRRRAR